MDNKVIYYYIALLVVCVLFGNRLGHLAFELLGLWSVPVTAVGCYWLWNNHERVDRWVKDKIFND